MRIGIVGCGAVARYCHVPAFRRMKGVSIAAVADPDESSRAAVANGSASAHERPEGVFADNTVDAVVISVPTAMHHKVATMAVEAGKPFYLEKPIATTHDEARELCALVESRAIAAAVGFNRRAHPLYSRARELVASGAVGKSTLYRLYSASQRQRKEFLCGSARGPRVAVCSSILHHIISTSFDGFCPMRSTR